VHKHTTPPMDAQPEDDAPEGEHCCDCQMADVDMQRFDTIVCAAVDCVEDAPASPSATAANLFLVALFDAERKAVEIAGLPKMPLTS
jgi:hypothetical protein